MQFSGMVPVLLLLSLTASCDAATPFQKVIEILTAMQQKGQQEQHEEQVQYASYKQFCDDALAQKKAAVETDEQEVTTLKAQVQKYNVDANTLQKGIQGIDEDSAAWNDQLSKSTSARDLEASDYSTTHKDYTESIAAIEKAIMVLRQQGANQATAALLARVVSLKKVSETQKRTLEEFLERDQQDPLASPGSASASVIDLLQKLRDKFTDERSKLEREEMKKKHSHELLKQSLETSLSDAGEMRGEKVQLRGQDLQMVADYSASEKDAQLTWDADKTSYSQVEAECTQTANEFEKRQSLRSEEIQTIKQAIDILNSQSAALVTVSVSQKKTVFAQLRSSGSVPKQQQVAMYLREEAQRIGSRTLSAIATKVSDDPFSKVKKMVQDLINRLKEQANEEAEHKAWCDSELAQNDQVRTTRTDDVERLQTQIDLYTSSVGKLSEEISEISQQVVALDKEAQERTQMRNEGKATNAASIKDAQDAQTALRNAMTMLKSFWARAGAASLVQIENVHTQPLFTTAYKGMGGQDSIIAVLETVQADFARIESETSATEVTSEQDYNKFMSDTAVDKAAKQTDIKHKSAKKTTDEGKLVQLNKDLTSTQKELETANKYYDQLKSSCLSTGESQADRDARRQEEIQSLQEAMRILNGEDIA